MLLAAYGEVGRMAFPIAMAQAYGASSNTLECECTLGFWGTCLAWLLMNRPGDRTVTLDRPFPATQDIVFHSQSWRL